MRAKRFILCCGFVVGIGVMGWNDIIFKFNGILAAKVVFGGGLCYVSSGYRVLLLNII